MADSSPERGDLRALGARRTVVRLRAQSDQLASTRLRTRPSDLSPWDRQRDDSGSVSLPSFGGSLGLAPSFGGRLPLGLLPPSEVACPILIRGEGLGPCPAGGCKRGVYVAISMKGGCELTSGRPGSNRRRSAWKADALPTELLPRSDAWFLSAFWNRGG